MKQVHCWNTDQKTKRKDFRYKVQNQGKGLITECLLIGPVKNDDLYANGNGKALKVFKQRHDRICCPVVFCFVFKSSLIACVENGLGRRQK